MNKKLNSSNVDDLLDENYAEAKKKELAKIKTSFNILDNEFSADKNNDQIYSSFSNSKKDEDKKKSLQKNFDEILQNENFFRKESVKE